MFLIGRADPKDPNGARKLSGLIQSGADVDLEGILDETTSKAKDFGYHPLLLPYHLYTDHYKNTSTQFDVVLKTVESVEQHIMTVLQNKSETIHQFSSKDDGDDGFEISYWGLAEQSKSLHEASMKVAEVSRRRRFEIDLANALKEELKLKRPAQNQMLRELHRYDRWANAHQSEIEGMPDRIDSLKNIVSHPGSLERSDLIFARGVNQTPAILHDCQARQRRFDQAGKSRAVRFQGDEDALDHHHPVPPGYLRCHAICNQLGVFP